MNRLILYGILLVVPFYCVYGSDSVTLKNGRRYNLDLAEVHERWIKFTDGMTATVSSLSSIRTSNEKMVELIREKIPDAQIHEVKDSLYFYVDLRNIILPPLRSQERRMFKKKTIIVFGIPKGFDDIELQFGFQLSGLKHLRGVFGFSAGWPTTTEHVEVSNQTSYPGYSTIQIPYTINRKYEIVGFYVGAGPIYSRGRHALSLLLNGSYKLGYINVSGSPRSVPKYSEHYNKSFVFFSFDYQYSFLHGKCIMDIGSRYYVPKINAENKTSAFCIQLGLGMAF
jgi:hypothetical protein